jgi:putative pyoverdin transport system ATP-binding/permease protein
MSSGRHVTLLRFLLRTSPWETTVAIAAGLASGACNAALLGWLNHALAEPARPLIYVFCALVAGKLITGQVARQSLARVSASTLAAQRSALAKSILATPLRRLEVLGTSRLLAVLTEDVAAIGAALSVLPSLAVNVAVLAGGTAYLFWLSPMLGLLVAAIVGTGLLIFRILATRAHAALHRARLAQDRLFSLIRALLSAPAELKRHDGRRHGFLSALQDSSVTVERENLDASARFGVAHSWSQAIVYLAIGAVVLARARLGAGDHVLTGFVLTIVYLTGPLASVVMVGPTAGRAAVALGRIDAAGLALTGERMEEKPIVPADWDWIELRDVTVRYESEDEPFVVGPVSLSIARGEIVFLTGGNGSGKSTLAKVACGLYEPDSGCVAVDGVVLPPGSPVLRQLTSGVLTEFFLFDTLFGMTGPGVDDKAAGLLSELMLDHKVTVRDGRLSTTDLSQGQRKRLALLVAQLEGRSLMVLDEWAAEQDRQAKEWFYRTWLPALKAAGRSAIVITHDDRYFDLADRVLFLENGRLRDESRPGIQNPDTPASRETIRV